MLPCLLLWYLQQSGDPHSGFGLLAAAGACLLLGLVGILIGRAPLDWTIDRYLERVPAADGCDYDDSDPTGMYEGENSSLASYTAWWVGRPLLLGCGGILFGLGGAVLACYAAAKLHWDSFSLWWLLLPIAVGYIVGRVTDKDPVGPLE